MYTVVGLTRAIVYLLKGEANKSLEYNLLAIPLMIIYFIYNIWYLKDIIQNENSLNKFIERHKKTIIIVGIILFSIAFVKNLNNPLLYE